MHFVFIPYGKRSEVELLLRDMEAQKHRLKLWKGDKKKEILIQSQIRMLPFGIWEYVFPKEDRDAVLHTLNAKINYYELSSIKMTFLRKMIKCKQVIDYDEGNYYPWIKDNVSIIALGIREDGEITDLEGLHKGWTHEAI